ncbi:MAG: asparagine synthase (glutamine-hydrolyzing) [Bacteroidota bacterium]
MCGIVGIIDWKNALSSDTREAAVRAMNRAIVHRGPDATGYFSNDTASLAMRRLAIIDQQGGQQPIFNETGTIGVVFNGEIYNYLSLQQALIKKGHRFSTNSDTEVLVHLYEEYGPNMLGQLQGMFSFCLFDISKKHFLLARDRFGEKPLFYHWEDGVFSFSSEIKSLLENKQITRKLNREALPYYFRTSLVPGPITLLEKVNTLPSGHYVFMTENSFDKKAYFQPNYQKTIKLSSEDAAIEYITPHLQRAVKRQMISDVPIGAFLSGGIDSSTVVALLQQHSSQPIKTFNVRFEDQAFDESVIARQVAKHCGTDHHEIFIPNVDFDETIFWQIIDHVGLPFRDTSAIPSYFVSKEIAKYVKVALSGDGGDELFGGYDLFQWYQKIVRLKQVARPLRLTVNAGLAIAQRTPGFNTLSVVRKLKRGVATSMVDVAEIPISLNEMFSQNQIQDILGSSKVIDRKKYPLLKNYPVGFSQWSPLRKVMYYRLQHTLPSNMLVKVDRMSMAHSLEVRAPFLDAELFEASVQLPDHLLVKGGVGKYLLRKIMQPHLPSIVFDHPKMGFSLPLYKYQNKAFQQLAQRLLFEENPAPSLIDKKILTEIYQRGIYTKKDTAKESVFQTSHQLWMVMMLFGWIKRFKVIV